MKSVCNTNPSTSQFNFTKDSQLALNHLSVLHPLQPLTLKQFTGKLTTLMALTSAHTVQTLSKVTVDNIIKSTGKI